MSGTRQITDSHNSNGATGAAKSSLSEVNAIFIAMAMSEVILVAMPSRVTGISRLLVSYATLYLPQLAFMTSVVDPKQLAIVSSFIILIFIRIRLAKTCFRKDILRKVLGSLVSRTAAEANREPKTYLTRFRSYLTFYTVAAILAVDFSVFPQRFTKSETFGTGLMDVGVGCYVVVNGASLGFSKSKRRQQSHLMKALWLLLLGLGRLALTTIVRYQVPEVEYGRHWNFFFTLACLQLSACLGVPSPRHMLVTGGVLLTVHQMILSSGLIGIVIAADRSPSWWSSNKEGLLSLPGYYALFLSSSGITHLLAKPVVLNGHDKVRTDRRILFLWLKRTVGASAALWVGLLVTETWIQPVSRRACNAAYVLWILALYVSMMWLDTAIVAAQSLLTAPEWQNPAQGACVNAVGPSQSFAEGGVPSTQPDMDRLSKSCVIVGKGCLSCEGEVSRWEGTSTCTSSAQTVVSQPLQPLSSDMLFTFVIANIVTGLINVALDAKSCRPWTSRLIILFYVTFIVSLPYVKRNSGPFFNSSSTGIA
eukprot:jgi/Botrbrau1/14157/Bobra.182_3s0097.1